MFQRLTASLVPPLHHRKVSMMMKWWHNLVDAVRGWNFDLLVSDVMEAKRRMRHLLCRKHARLSAALWVEYVTTHGGEIPRHRIVANDWKQDWTAYYRFVDRMDQLVDYRFRRLNR